MVGSSRPALLLLFGAVGCVLLIACANASSLILLRAAARSRELAIRRAIGATRRRLTGQMLTESAVLAAAGGAGALVLAMWAIDVFVRLAPAGIPRLETAHVDPAAATFAFIVSAGAASLFGIAPALHVQRQEQHDMLRSGRGAVTAADQRTRQLLVVVEIALSTMLLAGASLFIQSFIRLSGVDPGFRPSAVVAVDRVELPRRTGASRSAAFFDELLERLRQSPGIVAAGATIGIPLDSRARFFVDDTTFSIARRPLLPVGRRPSAALHVVSGDYFAAAGIPLKRGRSFDGRDRPNAPAVVIINETMARLNWPNEDPVGQTLTHDLTILPGQPATRQIVGIVGDVRHFSLEGPPEPQMFIPHLQMPWPSMALLLRTSLPPGAIDARRARRGARAGCGVARSAGATDGPGGVRSGRTSAIPRLADWPVCRSGPRAGHGRSLRHRGLQHSAANARAGSSCRAWGITQQMMRLVLGSGVKLAVLGTAVGIGGALAVMRAMTTMLFAIGPMDPTTYVVAPAAVIVVAVSACYVPARRIRSIDPLKALSDDGT